MPNTRVERDGISGRCASRKHNACAYRCACECHALTTDTPDAFRIADADAYGLMGARGDWHGRAYAWCVRGGHYHVEALLDATRGIVGVPNGSYAGHARAIARPRTRTRSTRTAVRVVRVARIMPRTPDDVMPVTPARAFVASWAATR